MSKENAIKVLKEVQNARDTLERNIFEVCRKHEQMDLFSYFDERERYGNEENDVIRIKRQVNEKIKEISNEIKDEVYKKASNVKNKGGEKKSAYDRRYGGYSQYNKNATVIGSQISGNKSKIPTKQTKPKSKIQRGKLKENKKAEPPPKSSSAYDELILQHLYGRQPHQSHRHTSKKEQPGFCSPHRYNVSKNYREPGPPIKENGEIKTVTKDFDIHPSNEYCIHLQPHETPYSVMNGFPTARALVEPSRDPSGRLPLPTTTEEVAESPKARRKKKHLSKAGPNVAVINIKADDTTGSVALRDKIRKRFRESHMKSKLRIQPLPNVDIDTTDPCSTLSSESSKSISVNDTRHTIEKSMNQPSFKEVPKSNIEENPYDFQEFISVQDIEKKNTSDIEIDFEVDESFKQPEISLPGCKIPLEGEYHGPSFPPRQIVNEPIETISVKMIPTLEKSAQNWLEKELLARLISQMVDQQNLLPTTEEFADNVSTISVQSEESKSSYDWIENLIGLQGIQLFVDAGIPVNEDLVKELIRCVILEYLGTLFGHPPPERSVEPVDLKPEETKVATPVSTPLPSPVSEKEEIHLTPDQSISDLTEQHITEIIEEKVSEHDDDDEELQYQAVKTPEMSIIENEDYHSLKNIVTPDATMIDDIEPSVCNDLLTPVHSEKTTDLTQFPTVDFEHTEKIMSPLSTVADEKVVVSEFCVTPAPVVLSVKSSPVTTSPSLPSTTVTLSSSATVGLSTFEEISSGEYLNADSVVSDGSEGELKLGGKFRSMVLGDDSIVSDSSASKPATKRHLFPPKPPRSIEKYSQRSSPFLSEGEINQTFRPLKSIGEVSDINKSDQTDFDTEDLDDDDNDPMTKLLHKIKSPPLHKDYPVHADRSEGEIIPELGNNAEKDRKLLSYGEKISNGSLNIDMLNDESDLVSSIKDDSDLNSRPVVGSRVINVKPASYGEVVDDNVLRMNDKVVELDSNVINKKPNDDAFQTDRNEYDNKYGDIAPIDASKSEGEFLHDDEIEDINFDVSPVQSHEEEEEDKEKLVMVLRLPEVEDEQNVSDDDYDQSTGAISSISEF